MKRCNECKKRLPFSEFTRTGRGTPDTPGDYTAKCKPCINKVSRARYKPRKQLKKPDDEVDYLINRFLRAKDFSEVINS